MMIDAKPGEGGGSEHMIKEINLFEYGDYTLSGVGGIGTSATVAASGYLTVSKSVTRVSGKSGKRSLVGP